MCWLVQRGFLSHMFLSSFLWFCLSECDGIEHFGWLLVHMGDWILWIMIVGSSNLPESWWVHVEVALHLMLIVGSLSPVIGKRVGELEYLSCPHQSSQVDFSRWVQVDFKQWTSISKLTVTYLILNSWYFPLVSVPNGWMTDHTP